MQNIRSSIEKGIPTQFGGIERHVEEISTRLVRFGHSVTVYARSRYAMTRRENHKGIRLQRMPSIPTKHLDAQSVLDVEALELDPGTIRLLTDVDTPIGEDTIHVENDEANRHGELRVDVPVRHCHP